MDFLNTVWQELKRSITPADAAASGVRMFDPYFRDNRLFLDESLCVKIDMFVELMQASAVAFAIAHMRAKENRDSVVYAKKLKELLPQLTEIRRDIETEFRVILGVGNEPKQEIKSQT